MRKQTKERISSRLTFFYKYIFTIVWIGGFSFGTLITFYEGSDIRWISLIILIACLIFIWWSVARLKYLAIENEYLIISNYLKTIRVPISEIKEVTENIYIGMHPVWIKFKTSTIFGKKIMFIPKFVFLFFESHPIVDDLKFLAKSIRINENMSQ